MAFSDDEIFEEYLKEIIDKEKIIQDWPKQKSYPYKYYDYSDDDLNDYEYQQNILD